MSPPWTYSPTMTADDLDRPHSRYLRFCDLIEAGETWQRVRMPISQDGLPQLRPRSGSLPMFSIPLLMSSDQS